MDWTNIHKLFGASFRGAVGILSCRVASGCLLRDARDSWIGREIGRAAGERKERRLRLPAAPVLAAFFLQVRLEPTVAIV